MAGESTSFNFVHAADLHLDSPFAELHGLAPHVANELREASLDAFDAIVNLALDRQSAFVLFAGDIYDGPDRGVRAQARFRAGLELLSEEGIDSFVVHGNHDPIESGWFAISEWPQRTTFFGSDEVDCVPVVRDGTVIATVQGISYATREARENLALRFSRPVGDGVHIGLLHCNVGSKSDHANYSPCTIADLKRARLDYWALGHIHARQILADGAGPGDPWIAYPGDTQARSMKRSERGAKGALVVRVANGYVERPEFVACDRVRFAEVDCPIDTLPDLSAVIDRLDDAARSELDASDGRSLVVRARLTGRGRLHAELTRPGHLDELRDALRDAAGTSRPYLWWDAIEDETGSQLSLDSIRRRGDFAADLVGLAESRAVDVSGRRHLADQLTAEAPGIVSAELRRIVDDDETLAELFTRATTMALEAISAEQS